MKKIYKSYDFLIIGGGIFGAYAALYLAGKGNKVLLVEKEKSLFTKASVVNQARLHGGYHYPRSIATAVMSDDNKARFTTEHKDFINFEFEKYYAVDKYGSFTDAAQFQRFCDHIGIRCEEVKAHPLFNYARLETIFSTTEYTFDPFLIAAFYKEQLAAEKNIDLKLYTKIKEANKDGAKWRLEMESLENQQKKTVFAYNIINATYSASNAVNELFGLSSINLMHEISEIALLTSPQLKDIGITIMDGPFCSLMPYGKSELLSLSSVAYTHHKVSYAQKPHFDCQSQNQNCRPEFLSNCNACAAKPVSNFRKMLSQMQQYLSDQIELHYYSSLFTIKSKLKANFIDDGRPTEINCLHQNPHFYCIFAGKINSIYEIEKVV